MPQTPSQRSVSESPPRLDSPYPEPLENAKRQFQRISTQIVMKAECFIDIDHTKETVDPYILEDVDSATREPFNVWLEAVLGLPEERLSDWVHHITEDEWYKDEIIQQGLIEFSNASVEAERYEPFASIANRILELGKDQLPGTKSYPIDDIIIVRNDPHYLNRIPEHSGLGAKRKPDLLAVRGRKVQLLEEANSNAFDWSDILTFVEMKYSSNVLFHQLQIWRSERGLPQLDRRTLLPIEPLEKITVANLGAPVPVVPWTMPPVSPPKKDIVASIKEPPAMPSRTLRPRPMTTNNADTEPQSEPFSMFEDDDEDDDPTYDNANRKRVSKRDYGGASSSAKKSRNDGDLVKAEVKLQAGGYALETAACTYGTRLFTTGIVLEDDKTSLWYYDAAGIIRTKETLSLMHDFEKFAAVLVAFACCEPSQWGSLPPNIIRPPKSAPYPESFPPKNLKGYTLEMTLPEDGSKVRVTLQDPVFTQYSLIGRRTFLYVIKTNSRKLKKPMVAKFSYQVTSRKREQDILEVAREAGVEHLPEVHMWEDFWTMSEGVRAIFFDRRDPDRDYEDRVFRGIVYSQYFPLKDLFSKSCELIPTMVYQMLDCLHDLRYKAKILHRDISANNVMWEMQGDEVVFKLIDFDFATFVDDEGKPAATTASSKHRTGTLAFMAWELIKDVVNRKKTRYRAVIHMLRHDIESLYYLAVYCMITMPEVKNSAKQQMYRDTVWAWESGSMKQIAADKTQLWEQDEIEDMDLPSQCESLRPWLLLFCGVIKGAQSRLRTRWNNTLEPFDQETVGGALTRDAIISVLKGNSVATFIEIAYKPAAEEASSSGALHEETIEEKAAKQSQAKEAAPAKRIPVKKATGSKDTTKGKKTATAKTVTPKKIAAARASKTKDTVKAKSIVVSETVTMQGLMRRGPTTRSMSKKAAALISG